MKTAQDIDTYIATFPSDVQEKLQQMRLAIHEAVPGLTEAMAYGIPTFKLNGNVVHFGGFKHHIGFYPAPQGLEAFKKELSKFKGAKGSVQFPLDEPLPLALVKKITKYRVKAMKKEASAKLQPPKKAEVKAEAKVKAKAKAEIKAKAETKVKAKAKTKAKK